MNKKILECTQNKQGSYILPFLWLHGESHQRLKEEILAIKNSGIREFCAESRPYDNFGKEQWWEDFGFILKTAKELDMKVWLLDDKAFPTGYANGWLESPERAHLRKVMLREKQADVRGPLKNVTVSVSPWVNTAIGEEILSVIAYKRCGEPEVLDPSSAIDLTPTLHDGAVYFDVPEGLWRVCTLIRTNASFNSSGNRFAYYIDMLRRESCRSMIDAVYQPHFDHFKEYFGTTFMGFFSDEPGFLDTRGTYLHKLGSERMYQPFVWRDDLPELIAESAGISVKEAKLLVPAMWENLGEKTSVYRMHYMEVVTKLYSENFCWALGDWCREHGVMYIGHIIEDLNAHMRLGYGVGHFFRALDGQDMAGMDIVLMQDVPGITDGLHRGSVTDLGVCAPEFFHYTLPKLAASHSHIQPLKKGRAMCEIFGAFGWAEGLTYMKQLADHMLVSGINHYVPHAFSPKEDDPDCPPHFYNGGKNTLYPLFKNLMEYMSRTSHVLCGGLHKASVAVFYNAESEWSGGRYELFQNVCAQLTHGLIDFDIIPYDVLENAKVKEGKLLVNGEDYGALIVSESQILPYSRLECFAGLKKAGLPVIFTGSLPEKSAENKDISQLVAGFEVTETKNLSKTLRDKGIYEISAQGNNTEYLRFYHINRDGEDIYMFYNDAITDTIDAWLTLPCQGEFLVYDAWGNKCYRGETENGKLHLVLEKGNAIIIAFGSHIPPETPAFCYEKERKPLDLTFDIYIKQAEKGDTEFKLYEKNSKPIDISAPDRMPHFSGEVLYKTTFTPTAGFNVLDLGEVGETAQVTLNGNPIGVRVNAPYKFDISSANPGENTLEILVRSNPGHARRDNFSAYIWIPPTGIIGDIYQCKY